MNKTTNEVLDLATRQHGLVTRADLSRLGVTQGRRRTLVNHGTLEPIGRKVFRAGGAPATDHQRILAGCLDAGGVASHRSAAWLHGIRGGRFSVLPQVTVPRPRREQIDLAEVHSTTWLTDDDVVVVDQIPCLGVARTLCSLASITPVSQLDLVRNAVDEAVRDGKASDAWLWWTLERLRRRGRTGIRRFERVLVERQEGMATESWLEREFLRILRAAGLPLPACQERISRDGAFVARVDFLYRELGLAIEVSGHAHHSTRSQTSADAARRTALVAAGIRVVEFTYDDIVRDPERVVSVVRNLIQGRVARSRTAA